MEKAVKKYFTPEEYLAIEETAEFKSEFYKGEIFAMTGASVNHNLLVGNFYSKLHQALADRCYVFMSDMRIRVETHDLFTYPDISVVCEKPKFYEDRDDTIINPILIVEVLSDSTKNYDRGEKFEFYRSLTTFQEYILVDQYKIHVEQFHIGNEGKWILSEHNDKKDILNLNKLDFQISLQSIYARVEFY